MECLIDGRQRPVVIDESTNLDAETLDFERNGITDAGGTRYPTRAKCWMFMHYSRECHICTAIESLARPRDTFRLAWVIYEWFDVPRHVISRWINSQIRITVECDASGAPRDNISTVLVDGETYIEMERSRYALVLHCLLFPRQR